MLFQKIVWLQSNVEINFIQFKRISHHSTKIVEFFGKEHHTLYQTCGKVNFFLSLLEMYSALEYSSKKLTKMRKGYLKNTITHTIIVLTQKIFKQISEILCNRYMMSGNQVLVESASNINSHIIISS